MNEPMLGALLTLTGRIFHTTILFYFIVRSLCVKFLLHNYRMYMGIGCISLVSPLSSVNIQIVFRMKETNIDSQFEKSLYLEEKCLAAVALGSCIEAVSMGISIECRVKKEDRRNHVDERALQTLSLEFRTLSVFDSFC